MGDLAASGWYLLAALLGLFFTGTCVTIGFFKLRQWWRDRV